MRYEILKDFKDGREAYCTGERREMDAAQALKFAWRGWVLVDGVTPDPETGGTLTLNIHNARMGHKSEIR